MYETALLHSSKEKIETCELFRRGGLTFADDNQKSWSLECHASFDVQPGSYKEIIRYGLI